MSGEPQCAVLLRRLAINDETALESIFLADASRAETDVLGERTSALIRIAALVATESALPSYQKAVTAALAAGANEDDIVAIVQSIAPIVGAARVTSAAPALAMALGYDLDTRWDS